jgi:hypothetical protein
MSGYGGCNLPGLDDQGRVEPAQMRERRARNPARGKAQGRIARPGEKKEAGASGPQTGVKPGSQRPRFPDFAATLALIVSPVRWRRDHPDENRSGRATRTQKGRWARQFRDEVPPVAGANLRRAPQNPTSAAGRSTGGKDPIDRSGREGLGRGAEHRAAKRDGA